MKTKCSECGKSLTPGARIFQLARGRYFKGFETPTYVSGSAVLYEGHEGCFTDFPLSPQQPPYTCVICEQGFRRGAEEVYAVVGFKPDVQYRRPDFRGHEMPYIAHGECWDLREEFS